VNVLQQNYALLQIYLGEIAFLNLSKAFLAKSFAAQKTIRWYCNALPDFLATYKPFSRNPEIQELATLELALTRAHDSTDVLSLTAKDIVDSKTALALKLHPSVQQLRFFHNSTSIWSALKSDQQPPKPHLLEPAQSVLVWRQGLTARFRIVGDDEALALRAKTTSPNSPYFRGWLEAELLLPPDRTTDILEK
jgi:hypothetical protein